MVSRERADDLFAGRCASMPTPWRKETAKSACVFAGACVPVHACVCVGERERACACMRKWCMCVCVWVHVCGCICVGEREREREKEKESTFACMRSWCMCVFVRACVCVYERERERERDRERERERECKRLLGAVCACMRSTRLNQTKRMLLWCMLGSVLRCEQVFVLLKPKLTILN
jgi:hypothetical protein